MFLHLFHKVNVIVVGKGLRGIVWNICSCCFLPITFAGEIAFFPRTSNTLFPQLNTQSGRLWSLEVVSLCTKWIILYFPRLNTELDKVVMPKWLFLSWLLFVICFNSKGFVNSGKRFISFKSSIWFVIILWELFGNILYGNPISLLSGDSEIIPAVRSFLQMGFL